MQVRTARGKLVTAIRDSGGGYHMEECIPLVNSLINADCDLSLKYKVLAIKDLLKNNCKVMEICLI